MFFNMKNISLWLSSALVLASSIGAAAEPSTLSQKIDALVAADLEKNGIKPNAAISDETFLRRVYLNIGGRIPTIEEAEKFQSSAYENKRERLIDDLVGSEAYASNAYHFWADILRVNDEVDGAAKSAYQLWINQAIRENKPYDQMVRDLVTASGKIWENGATGYYFRDRGMPLDNMSNTVRVFLGTRLECAQCHNHPFDKWTQMDYYEMAAFSFGMNAKNYRSPNRDLVRTELENRATAAYAKETSRLSGNENFPEMKNERQLEQALSIELPKAGKNKKRKDKGRGKIPAFLEANNMSKERFREIAEAGFEVANAERGKTKVFQQVIKELYDPLQYTNVTANTQSAPKLPHDYQYSDGNPHQEIQPKAMFGAAIDPANLDDDKINAYASWMTSRDNPTFTKVIVNRLWKEVFGLGIFEPVDDLTDHVKPANPELLAYLEVLMKELDYDVQAFLSTLYNTETYQRKADQGEIVLGMPFHFQGPVLRRMSAEQMWDSLVALALPESDNYRPDLKRQLAAVEKVRQIYISLEDRPTEDFMAMLEELAPALKGKGDSDKKIRAAMVEAKNAGDDAKFNELRRKLKNTGNNLRQKISEIAYIHLNKKMDGADLLLALGMNEVAAGMMNSDKATIASQENAVVTSLPKIDFKKSDMPEGLSKSEKKKWAISQKADYKTYTSLISGMARASELRSPAPRGHFLRDFGQSDREVIENAADHASVPQALNLLNGQMVEALTNKYSTFGQRVHAAGDVEEKTRMIFQAMLTRQPSKKELELVKSEVANSGDSAYEGIVWALLNTQQFMFVQ